MSGSESYDVVVIGGGIHGAGAAQAAAACGTRVLLLEQERYAGATSGRSSKLIHGGLRYLETGQLGLVRESLRERETLLKIAPALVKRAAFYIPVYAHTRRRPWRIRAGLTLYALLGGLEPAVRFRRLPRPEWAGLDGLKTAGLEAVFCYQDAQTDDVLPRAVLDSARRLEAGLNARRAFFAPRGRGLQPALKSGARSSAARAPWSMPPPLGPAVLTALRPPPRLAVDLVQGALRGGNPPRCLARRGARRACGVRIPWRADTDRHHRDRVQKAIPAVAPLAGEIDYLLETFRLHFPSSAAARGELRRIARVAAGAGYIFTARETVSPPPITRRPRLVTIYGGKLTGYRATAERVLRRSRRNADRPAGPIPRNPARPAAGE